MPWEVVSELGTRQEPTDEESSVCYPQDHTIDTTCSLNHWGNPNIFSYKWHSLSK